MYCDLLPTLVELAGGPVPDNIDGFSLKDLLAGDPSNHRRKHALLFGQRCLVQRAIRTKQYKLIWNPTPEKRYHQAQIMNTKGKYFHKAWLEWVAAAKTDPDAKAKVDRVLIHPEFELYDVREDPFETSNLAALPEHAERVKQMFEDLTISLKELNDPSLKKHAPPREKGDATRED